LEGVTCNSHGFSLAAPLSGHQGWIFILYGENTTRLAGEYGNALLGVGKQRTHVLKRASDCFGQHAIGNEGPTATAELYVIAPCPQRVSLPLPEAIARISG